MSQLTITILQSNLHWEDKQANLAMFEKKIRSIAERTEIILLPEMFTTGFSMNATELAETMEGETVRWMKRMSAEKKAIIGGSIIAGEGGQYFNRFLWALPDGSLGHYDKRHLFAYAGEDAHYTAGTRRLIASAKGWRINLQVCYDLRFPVWARQSVTSAPEYDLLVYVANWPERRVHAWKTLLQARAIENQCFVIGVNRTGDDGLGIHYSGESMVVDPMGEVLYTKKDNEDNYTFTLDKKMLEETRNKLPFLKDGDAFMMVNTGDD